MLIWESFLLAFTALLPLINPIGSALVFLGLVGPEPPATYKRLARHIAVATFVFLMVIEFLGSLILAFFAISLPVVQVSGGLIIAARAWSLLFEEDAGADARNKHRQVADTVSEHDDLDSKIFYPFTFPITAGPGTLVTMLTLSARAPGNMFAEKFQAHGGIACAALALSFSVYLCYAYAPKLTAAVSPSTAHGILRVVAFILMCIGVQITWKGASLLWLDLIAHR